MLSPVKLYKHDMKNQRVARTWGPHGKPSPGCSGSICYRHKNVDWGVHRLAPAVYERGKPGSVRRKVISGAMQRPKKGSHLANKYPGLEGMQKSHVKHLSTYVKNMSPRWGEGVAPGRREGRNPVALPKKGSVEVSKGTKVAVAGVGAAAAGYGGYKVYKHFHNQKQTDRGPSVRRKRR